MSLPTLYEHYTAGGITAGLSANQSYFTLNNKNITLFSGALHYFRVPQQYWRDRLRKMRAAGLNTVETYVPWNLHEPEPDVFDFGAGGSDYQELLNIATFLKTAQEEDLLAIVRPGPYICGEWEFGGLPSWLLNISGMKVRTSNPAFMDRVRTYFTALLQILSVLQFTKGGPIIAVQIENEYGNIKNGDEPVDVDYLKSLKQILESNGIVELLFTSDTPSNGNFGSLPDVLYTANFQDNPENQLSILQGYQPGKPLMVMEYWTGWFDHWSEQHHTRTNAAFSDVLERIIKFPSSVNMYMFHGGTSWGFLNGGNIGDGSSDNSDNQPDTNSYDYDAPLTEAGDYTDKYYSVQRLVEQYNEVKTKLPQLPAITPRTAYEPISAIQQLTLGELIAQSSSLPIDKPVAMEYLPINNGAGQSYGYIAYRKSNVDVPANSALKIQGHVCDTILITLNDNLVNAPLQGSSDLDGFGYWRLENSSIGTGVAEYTNATVTFLVENMGRTNFGKLYQFNQNKGLWQGDILLNDQVLNNFEAVPLEFKKRWTSSLTGWHEPTLQTGPALYRAVLNVDQPTDTYIDMRNWNKGIVIVNGFVLSRYFKIGPQQTIYLPAPFLKSGANEILIFEHFAASTVVNFNNNAIFDTPNK